MVLNSSCCSTRFNFSQWEKFISYMRVTYLSRLTIVSDTFVLDLSLEIWFKNLSLQKLPHMSPCISKALYRGSLKKKKSTFTPYDVKPK